MCVPDVRSETERTYRSPGFEAVLGVRPHVSSIDPLCERNQ